MATKNNLDLKLLIMDKMEKLLTEFSRGIHRALQRVLHIS